MRGSNQKATRMRDHDEAQAPAARQAGGAEQQQRADEGREIAVRPRRRDLRGQPRERERRAAHDGHDERGAGPRRAPRPRQQRAEAEARAEGRSAIAGAAPPRTVVRPLRMSWPVGALGPRRAGVRRLGEQDRDPRQIEQRRSGRRPRAPSRSTARRSALARHSRARAPPTVPAAEEQPPVVGVDRAARARPRRRAASARRPLDEDDGEASPSTTVESRATSVYILVSCA